MTAQKHVYLISGWTNGQCELKKIKPYYKLAEGEPLSIYEVREDSLFLHGALVRVVQVEEDDVNKFKSYLCGHWKRTL